MVEVGDFVHLKVDTQHERDVELFWNTAKPMFGRVIGVHHRDIKNTDLWLIGIEWHFADRPKFGTLTYQRRIKIVTDRDEIALHAIALLGAK